MKKTYLLLCALFIASVSVVIVLYKVSYRMNHIDNGFTRLFPPHVIVPESELNIPSTAYYIAGATPGRVYFASIVKPLEILTSSLPLGDTARVTISIKNLREIQFKQIQVKIDSPHFFIADGVRPALLKGTTDTWEARRFMPDSSYFTEAVRISPNSFIIRSFSRQTLGYVFGKKTLQPPHLRFESGLLTKQIDGLFCMDGMLHYSRELNQLVYLYHYRNEFIFFDTSLVLKDRGKTIDTISHAQIKVDTLHREQSVTLSAPPLLVNNRSRLGGNYLFVHSNLMANNEERKNFNMASVIDVYDMRDKTYRFSFYIFNPDKQKLRDFYISGKRLVVMFGSHVYTYKMGDGYFK